VLDTRDSGWTIYNTATAKNSGLTARSTKENTWLARNMDAVFTAGTMAHGIMVNGKKIRSRASALTRGLMDASMRESGLIITWTVSVFTPGRTADSIEANTRMTRSMGTVSTHGQTGGPTQAAGAAANSTDSVLISCQDLQPRADFGRKASVLSGSNPLRATKSCRASSTINNSSARQKAVSM